MPDDRHTTWLQTAAPLESAWTPDIHFADNLNGWAVNTSGQILATADGGRSWTEQALLPTAYLSCVSFSGARSGWVGSLSPEQRLFHTRDGGATWLAVTNLPPVPRRIASLSAVDDATVFAAGSAYADEGAAVACTVDGGKSWKGFPLDRHLSVVTDARFDEFGRGWVVGGRSLPAGPGGPNGSFQPVILETRDAGKTWRDAAVPCLPQAGLARRLSLGADGRMAVSLAGPEQGAVVTSDDRGRSWRRLPVKLHSDLDGVVFAEASSGWVGGWGNCTFIGGHTLATRDGGANWERADQAGLRVSRFFATGGREPTIFASGDTIYRLSNGEASSTNLVAARRAARALRDVETSGTVAMNIQVPRNSGRMTVLIWERKGRLVRRLLDTSPPSFGSTTVSWDMRDDRNLPLPTGPYIVRIVIDKKAESRIVFKSR